MKTEQWRKDGWNHDPIKLADIMSKYVEAHEGSGGLDMETIDDILTIAKEPINKWISVDERLPSDYVDVLTINKSGFMHVVHFNRPNWLYKPNFGMKSIVASGHRSITHWMPLPEPPTDKIS